MQQQMQEQVQMQEQRPMRGSLHYALRAFHPSGQRTPVGDPGFGRDDNFCLCQVGQLQGAFAVLRMTARNKQRRRRRPRAKALFLWVVVIQGAEAPCSSEETGNDKGNG
jgi:hypothetical protein